MRVDAVAFAPLAAGTEWLPVRGRTRARMVEAIVPPGRSGSSLPREHPRPCWSIIGWDATAVRYVRDPAPACGSADTSVLAALLWCRGSSDEEDWVIDSTSLYVGYLLELLRPRAQAQVTPWLVEHLGDPALDLIQELGEAAEHIPRLRVAIHQSLGRTANVSLEQDLR